MQCACYVAEGDGLLRLNPCPEHERWAKAIRQKERERCAALVSHLRATWFHEGIPGDTAVPAGVFARSLKQLADVMLDSLAEGVETK